ncbi:hypothetical protein [Flavobacterium chungangense]|uniref:Uncharacterized protein n=1 Tax=Flavobacterium chungangense TaxID=554283 RepID=A0A6V6YZI0_9FLAO|nr:hypothetical protein [Flavobacterium chungangense]CAD0004893.1 hypothetical protein FLACHUCJ7_02113 [Flavobacterium chungangense]
MMNLDDKVITFILGIILMTVGGLLYYSEKIKSNERINIFLGYKFFKHYGRILVFFGSFLIIIAIHSFIYR